MVDNPNANGAAEVITPPPLDGLDAGAGTVTKFKLVLLPAIFATIFLLVTKAGVDAALPYTHKELQAWLSLQLDVPQRKNVCVANNAGLVSAFVAPNIMACAMSVTEAEDFTPPAVNKNLKYES